ncbi:hypothetical protein ABMA28_003909 [Loxostege sticticalis]|uniref:Uncharacterized protein n=1 Tax=Loxostege sticticalis TaxID=481309 RepID=A0ABD0STH6_LOXSC
MLFLPTTKEGLLVWGYFKMLSLSMFAYLLIEDLTRILAYQSRNVPSVLIIFICLVMIDIIFNIMFIVAGHMKHQQLFKMYFYYSLVFLGTFVVGYVILLGTYFYTFKGMPAYMFLWLTLDTLYIAVPIVMVQIYVTLLVRSETRKLDNNSNFQFVNTAAEATCSMDLNNIETSEETE